MSPAAHESSPRGRWVPLLVLAVVCASALVLHVGIGSYRWIPPADVLGELFRGDMGDGGSQLNAIIWRIRLPQALTSVLVGAILGMVGSAFQALFRNPLADPYIVGVSSGAAVGGALAMTLGVGAALGGLGTMVGGFAGGMLALGAVFRLSTRRGVVDVTTLLLAGVVMGALLSAVLMLVLLGSGQDTNVVLRWLMGNTASTNWLHVAWLAVFCAGGGAVLMRQTRGLNAYAVAEASAQRLGVDTRALKRSVLLAGTAMTAIAVGTVGVIGFLGLVAPHIARRLTGVDWRVSLPASGLVGATILLAADVVSQRATPNGLPVGIVTALLGAPFLIVLMRRRE